MGKKNVNQAKYEYCDVCNFHEHDPKKWYNQPDVICACPEKCTNMDHFREIPSIEELLADVNLPAPIRSIVESDLKFQEEKRKRKGEDA